MRQTEPSERLSLQLSFRQSLDNENQAKSNNSGHQINLMNEFSAYFNGEWVPRNQCKVDIADRGFTLGDAVYEAERTFGGEVFDLQGHVDRLYRSLEYVKMDPGINRNEMASLCSESISRNRHMWKKGSDFALRQYVSRGTSVLNNIAPLVYVGADYVNFDRFAGMYENGGHAIFSKNRSYSPNALDPKIKHLSRMNFALAEREVALIDPTAWPVLLDQAGNVSEGTTFNFWIVKDGRIKTPKKSNILEGITRKTAIALAGTEGIPVSEEDIQLYDVYTADEIFITATSFSILPISRVDNRELRDKVPGKVCRKLIDAWSEMVGLDIINQAKIATGIA